MSAVSPSQAEASRRELAESKAFGDKPIVTEIVAFSGFYPAEDYHRRYYRENPEQAYCQVVITPKLNKLRKTFKVFLRQDEADHT